MKARRTQPIAVKLLAIVLVLITIAAVMPNQAQAASSVSIRDGEYVVTSGLSDKDTALAVDVVKAAKAENTNVIVYNASYKDNQRFKVESRGSGWYSITDKNSGLALSVDSDNKNICVKKYTGAKTQLFCFESAGKGYFYIKNKGGLYLDVQGGKQKSGSNLIVYKLNKGKGQKWRLNGFTTKDNVLYVAGSTLSDYKLGSKFTTSKKYYYYVHGTLTYLGGSQCFGYANYVQKACFGEYNQTTVATNITSADSLKKYVMLAGVGAHIRVPRKGYEHSVAVINIKPSGITIADANGTAGSNLVGKKYYTWSEFLSKWCVGGKVLWIKQSY